MATFTKAHLSGSTNGRGIKVVAVATPGTTIHTSVAGTTPGTYDEIWIYAYNGDSVIRLLTIEFGGVTVPDDTIKVTLAAQSGLILVIPGFPLQNACVVKAFGEAANVLIIHGFVNKIAV